MIKRKLATIQIIKEVQPIEKADAIEKVRVKDWWAVVKRDTFKEGDLCVFFEIDSLLPLSNPAFDFLAKGTKSKTMTIKGKEYTGYRLKTIRLRKQISQGLALPLKEFFDNPAEYKVDQEVSEILGIVKYEPPVPANLAGKAKGFFPGFLRKTNEERIQNCADLLEKHKNETFYITEKLDGSSATFYKKNDELGVCSRNLELLETKENTLWKIANENDLKETLPNDFAIQGEVVGEGIQKNPLKIKGQKLFVFNVYNIKDGRYLDFEEFVKFCEKIGVDTVPIIDSAYILNNSVEELLEIADGKSKLLNTANREGLVFRPIIESEDEINGSISRLSFKVVSNKYLLKEK